MVTDNGIAQVKVVIPRREEEAISCQPGNREWVTVIEAISGAEELLPAFVIFEGKKVQDQWVNLKMDERMKIAVSEKGWTDSELGLEWLKHFEEHTRATVGKHRLLIMDGHASHASEQFVRFCEDHQVIPLCLPLNPEVVVLALQRKIPPHHTTTHLPPMMTMKQQTVQSSSTQ